MTEIIVGFDGSDDSENAVLWAASEARARGARLRIRTAFKVPIAGDAMYGVAAPNAYQACMDAAEQTLAGKRVEVARSHPGLEIVSEAVAGVPAQVLIDRVEREDLVVVGASAHHHAQAFWLGSTPRAVVRHSACPVVVVRGPVETSRPQRVVVGVDGSASSAQAVEWAGEEADRHQVNLVVVHTWSYPYAPVDAASSQAHDLMRVDAECLLERVVEAARDRFGAGVVGELIESAPVAGLLQATRHGDLLVLGSRGRGALTSGVFGSTVNSILDEAVVPVVVIPHAEHQR